MASDLLELFERLDWCKAQIGDLEQKVSDFIAKEIEISVRLGKAIGSTDIVVLQRRLIPTAISSQAGVITNELRAVVDGLASQLAVRNNQDTLKVSFPVSETPAKFNQDGKSKIKKLSTKDQLVIANLNPAKDKIPDLYALHHADIHRKHTELCAKAVGNSGVKLGYLLDLQSTTGTKLIHEVYSGQPEDEYLVYDANIINVYSAGSPRPMIKNLPQGMKYDLKFALYYQTPEVVKDRELIHTLKSFHKTSKDILELFV